MKRPSTRNMLMYLSAIFTVMALSLSPLAAADVGKISKEDLKKMLDNPDVVILDVRTGKDWSASEFKIKGAVRANPREFNTWAMQYPKDKKLVLY